MESKAENKNDGMFGTRETREKVSRSIEFDPNHVEKLLEVERE